MILKIIDNVLILTYNLIFYKISIIQFIINCTTISNNYYTLNDIFIKNYYFF